MPSADAAEGVAEGVTERAALWQAAKLGKLKEVKAALDATVVDLDDIDVEGNTLLHMAASQGHKLLVKELLRRGADAQVISFAGKKCYDAAHELNYWEVQILHKSQLPIELTIALTFENFCQLGDYIREKVGLETLGPSNKWQGEPGAPSLGGEITDDAISQLMHRRERQQRLSESWKLLAQVDMDLVIAAVADSELNSSSLNFSPSSTEESAGQRAVEEAKQSEREAMEAVQKLRAALGDARRAKVLEQALEQIWSRSSVLRPTEQGAREDAAAEAAAGGGGGGAAVGAGGRLEEELGRLAVQMKGLDVDGLIASLKTCQEDKRTLEARVKTLEEHVTVLNSDLRLALVLVGLF